MDYQFILPVKSSENTELDVTFNTGNTDSIRFIIQVVEEVHGVPINYSEYDSAALFFKKPDKTITQRECTLDSNGVTCRLKPADYATGGVIQCELQLYKGDIVAAPLSFRFNAQRTLVSAEFIESLNASETFSKLINDAKALVQDIIDGVKADVDARLDSQDERFDTLLTGISDDLDALYNAETGRFNTLYSTESDRFSDMYADIQAILNAANTELDNLRDTIATIMQDFSTALPFSKVEASDTNGSVRIDNIETQVYDDSGVNERISGHLANEMPHIMTSNEKTYRYGFKLDPDGGLIFKYEEETEIGA